VLDCLLQDCLARSLVENPQVGTNTQLNRAVKDLIQFEEWTSASIETRQEMLMELSAYVWGMPTAENVDGNDSDTGGN
jgi:hypothetical protein